MPREEVLPTLLERIDAAVIPRQHGGEYSGQEHGAVPNLDARTLSSVSWSKSLEGGKLPIGPLKWVASEGGGRTVLAVGKEKDGIVRREVVGREAIVS